MMRDDRSGRDVEPPACDPWVVLEDALRAQISEHRRTRARRQREQEAK